MPPKKKVAGLIKLPDSRRAPLTRHRPSVPLLVSTASTSWSSARRTTPRRESQRGNVIPVEITVYEDRSFTFITKTPPAAELIKKAAGVKNGSATPHTDKVGKLTDDQVREIAETEDDRPQCE